MEKLTISRLIRLFLLVPLALAAGVSMAEAKKKAPPHKKQAVTRPSSPLAKEIFGRQTEPAPLAARAIGSYAKGCLAGAKPLAVTGPAWQAMRLSRNRNWGHPALIAYLERLAADVKKNGEWPGLLVGDLSQPMGGPMTGGHASHQVGLDADIWLKPMPDRTLSREERETEAPVSMLAPEGGKVDPAVWTPERLKLIKRAASYKEVARIFVHPAIKKALCEGAGTDRAWLTKVHPYWGHHYHFHVRLNCPPGMASCQNQTGAPHDEGCGKEVEAWLAKLKGPVKPEPTTPVLPPSKRFLTMADLPAECSKLVGYDPQAKVAAVPAGPVPLPERRPAGTAAPKPSIEKVIPAKAAR
jgi:penicillin-insensitive murein DD-endopeptidase